jgi:hypothetical protein
MIFSDVSLARRLERAEARGNAGFVATRARIDPESGAEWIEVAGAYVMYDGASSPLTQTFGLGLFDQVTAVELGRRQGAQLALLESRLRCAKEHGCDLAMMCALPGSASQRNAERQGFRIAYTRIKWMLAGNHGGTA